jgi:hypothetical protein
MPGWNHTDYSEESYLPFNIAAGNVESCCYKIGVPFWTCYLTRCILGKARLETMPSCIAFLLQIRASDSITEMVVSVTDGDGTCQN